MSLCRYSGLHVLFDASRWYSCRCQVMSRKVQPTYTPEEVKAAFKVFEQPNSGLAGGHVRTAALERALTTYGSEKLSLEEAQDLLSQVCATRGGCLLLALTTVTGGS